jgi:hypothetical protein
MDVSGWMAVAPAGNASLSVIEALAMTRSPFSIPVAPTNSLFEVTPAMFQTTGYETAAPLSYRFTGVHRV